MSCPAHQLESSYLLSPPVDVFLCFCVSVCGTDCDSLACVSCFNLLTCVDLLLPVTALPQLFVLFVFFSSSSCCPSHLLSFITCFSHM